MMASELDGHQAAGCRDSLAIFTAVFAGDVEMALDVAVKTDDAYFTLAATVGALAGILEPLPDTAREEIREAWARTAQQISAALLVAETP